MGQHTAARFMPFSVGDVRIDAVPLDDAIDLLLDGHGPRAVHLCNAYTISLAAHDDDYRAVLNQGALNLPDGMPLVWIARRLGIRLSGATHGSGLMAGALDRGRTRGTRHYLFGSTHDVLETLLDRIDVEWPEAEIVGCESPPFRELTDSDVEAAIDRMREARADIVWVGLGTPKQDDVVERLAALGDHTYVAVGAAFDFLAGTKRRAPEWMQRVGLEWLFRLASEPRRLWKRYLVGNARFLTVAHRAELGPRPSQQ